VAEATKCWRSLSRQSCQEVGCLGCGYMYSECGWRAGEDVKVQLHVQLTIVDVSVCIDIDDNK